MPIRPQFRHFYGTEWRNVIRPRILKRAGGRFDKQGRYQGKARCEQCRVPDRRNVWRHGAEWRLKPVPSWRIAEGWHQVKIILTVAHLDHGAGPEHDRDENLKALCQSCHNRLDAKIRAEHARESRKTKKDGKRPMLSYGAIIEAADIAEGQP